MAQETIWQRRSYVSRLMAGGVSKRDVKTMASVKFDCSLSAIHFDINYLNNEGLPNSCQSATGIKLKVLKRDDFTCQYCSTTEREYTHYAVEHIIPQKIGGATALYNLVVACFCCNTAKGRTIWVPKNFIEVSKENIEHQNYVIANAVKDCR